MRKRRRRVVGLAIVLVLVAVGWLLFQSSPSEPTRATTAPGRLEALMPTVPIDLVIDLPEGAGNAADDYQKGLVELRQEGTYEKVMGWRQRDPGGRRKPFPSRVAEYIHAGAAKTRMTFFEQFILPADAVTDRGLDVLEDLYKMAEIAQTRIQLDRRRGQSRQAEQLSQDLLVFGYHVTCERVRVAGVRVGVAIQEMAVQSMIELQDERGESEAARRGRDYLAGLKEMAGKLESKQRETTGRGAPQAGDLLSIARHDTDRAWRIEAILKLGQCLHDFVGWADRRAIRRLLDQAQRDEDSFIRAAASRAASQARKGAARSQHALPTGERRAGMPSDKSSQRSGF